MRVNRRVSIWKHVRLADGKWRYCRPVLDLRRSKLLSRTSAAKSLASLGKTS